jgi:hypothetical protein
VRKEIASAVQVLVDDLARHLGAIDLEQHESRPAA